MSQKSFILIDATMESRAPAFARNPIFTSWLGSYAQISDALEVISGNHPPYSLEVYVARDSIFDDVMPREDGQRRTLIQTFNGLETINHVSIFCPTLIADPIQNFRSLVTQPRMIKNILSVFNLDQHLCLEGYNYYNQEISYRIGNGEMHLVSTLTQRRDALMEYLQTIENDRRPLFDVLLQQHFNRPSEKAS